MRRRMPFLRTFGLSCVFTVVLQAAGGELTLTVRVDGFEHADGAAGVAVWHTADGFPEDVEHAVATRYVPIGDGTTLARFVGLVPGAYAVTVYHDRNDNRRFDKNWLGIPTEAWGVSNNVRHRLRAPSFDEASREFEAGDHTVDIHVE